MEVQAFYFREKAVKTKRENCRVRLECVVLWWQREGEYRGRDNGVLTISLTTKIFDPKIETYLIIGVDMTSSHPLPILTWNHPSSCPR